MPLSRSWWIAAFAIMLVLSTLISPASGESLPVPAASMQSDVVQTLPANWTVATRAPAEGARRHPADWHPLRSHGASWRAPIFPPGDRDAMSVRLHWWNLRAERNRLLVPVTGPVRLTFEHSCDSFVHPNTIDSSNDARAR